MVAPQWLHFMSGFGSEVQAMAMGDRLRV